MEIPSLLWDYTRWANDIVIMTLERYGPQTPAFSLRLMSHICNAQSVWLARIIGQAAPAAIWEEHDLGRIRQLNSESLQGLKAAIDEQGNNLGAIVAYTNSSGIAFENSVLDILMQVFTHGGYHRAQIAMDLRQHGLEPVNTDYISWIRASRR
ncbi:MAG TPA: DinB family protein [Puia sp.]|nr:DinB family protein [Puia sp.]